MSKYFSKAVFYTERKNRIYTMLAFTLIYLFSIYQNIVYLYAVKKDNAFSPPNPTHIINFGMYTFLVIVLLSVINSYMNKDKKYYFMLTEPYSRDSIIITKTMSLISSFAVPTLIYGFISFIIVALNKKYYYFYNQYIGDEFSKVMLQLFLGILFIIAILTFITMLLQFLQICFGKSIAGIILPFIMLAALSTLSSLLSYFTSRKLGPIRDFWEFMDNIVFNYGAALGAVIDGVPQSKSLYQLTAEYHNNFNPWISLALILISIVLLHGSILLNRKLQAENTSNVFSFKFTEVIFKAVFSFFIAVIVSLMFAGIAFSILSLIVGGPYTTHLIEKYGLSGKENIEHTVYLVLNILWIPFTIWVYKLFGKVMKKGGIRNA